MKLLVHVMEARNLPCSDTTGPCDPFVKLQLGKHRGRTRAVKRTSDPVWDEEFAFRVGDLKQELSVSVVDEGKHFADDCIGRVKVLLSSVIDAEKLSLGTKWYPLQPKGKKPRTKDCGEIRLTISLSQSTVEETFVVPRVFSHEISSDYEISTELNKRNSLSSKSAESTQQLDEIELSKQDKLNGPMTLIDRLWKAFTGNNVEVALLPPKDSNSSMPILKETEIESEKEIAETPASLSFDDMLKQFESRHKGVEIPTPLQGGVLIDQQYAVAAGELNSLLHSPDSNFLELLAEIQGTTGLLMEPWKLENDGEVMKRVISYTKAPTKLVKAVKATEEQSFLKADGDAFAVLASVSTPDVPFGSTFRTEVLACVTPDPDLPSGEKSSRLVISWRSSFLQSTIMKSMIENGARQGLKDTYIQFAELLAQKVKPVNLKEDSHTEQMLGALQTEQESDWKLAARFFGNFTVLSAIVAFVYVIAHIVLLSTGIFQGLEFTGLDLPDSFGEVVVGGILVLQGQRLLNTISKYIQAKRQRGGDHGIKAQGDGWLLTIVLIEGINLAAGDSTGFSDPYVVFTCNGNTRASSVKFQTLEPQWNEIFEFDAMYEPPSVMKLDVYDFDGPFDEVTSLGHAEVSFLTSNVTELGDVWIPLDGKVAQACQSKLHLRIFLRNSKGADVVKEYLDKVEKETGKKISARSPQTNTAFQKIFGLPPEEFLINDFTCHLKRKMPIQGRLFLSPRLVGFYSNFFGQKTKFFFLWEDIEGIEVIPPTLASMGSPSLLFLLRKGRGFDARHGARALDEEGRLKFHFQSFVSYSVAHRTIMALWKAKLLSPEQKLQLVGESEDTGSFLGMEEAKMSEIFSSILTVNISFVMELFEGNSMEKRVMEKIGCEDYAVTSWEPVKSDIFQRQVHYKITKNKSQHAVEVASTQQKYRTPGGNGWIIEEVLALQGIPLGEYFNVHIRYQIEDSCSKHQACTVQVSVGTAWLKRPTNERRITKNVMSNASSRIKLMFAQLEIETASAK